jgi:hypothetical protein
VIPPPIAADATRDIASVQIAIVARSERPDPKYSGSQTFVNMQGDTIEPEHIRVIIAGSY